MSLFNNNLNDILNNKAWNDSILDIENDRTNNNIHYEKYTNAYNIYNDPKVKLLANNSLIRKGKLPQYYYDEVFLRQQDQPYLIDEYGDPLEAGRDMSLFNTISKQPVVVSSYLVDNKSVKKYAQATTTRQKISNAFDFGTLQRIEQQDFDSRLLKAISIKNN